jgi:hypothetical protein
MHKAQHLFAIKPNMPLKRNASTVGAFENQFLLQLWGFAEFHRTARPLALR